MGEREDAAELTVNLATRLAERVGQHDGVTRRAVLGGLGVAGAGALGLAGGASANGGQTHGSASSGASEHGNFGPKGTYQDVDFDPHSFLREFNTGTEDREVNSRVYRREPEVYDPSELDGDTERVREFEFSATKKDITIAPGLEFTAWTYNDQVPGPTIRAVEGDVIRIKFSNGQRHAHTIHPHLRNVNPRMDGIPQNGPGLIDQGDSFVYEWKAQPAGMHFYHCHSLPLKEHIHRGLYGVMIVDPDPDKVRENPREYVNYQGPMGEAYVDDLVEEAELRNHEHRANEVDEMVMVMNGFDTNFDGNNEVYAANTQAFAYGVDWTNGYGDWKPAPNGSIKPIRIDKNERQRIYLLNVIEFDLVNSLHTHSQFFDYYDHGTTLYPTHKKIDTIMQCQAQRGIVELDYSSHEPGLYMFHAHQSEFAELGWMSFFEVVDG